jgi:hypothetical protein
VTRTVLPELFIGKTPIPAAAPESLLAAKLNGSHGIGSFWRGLLLEREAAVARPCTRSVV